MDGRFEIAGIDIGLGSDERYYMRAENVEQYDDVRRDNPGGQYIDAREKDWIDRLFEGDLDDSTVLDAGGGTGWFTRYLEDRGATVQYLDASTRMVDQAEERNGFPKVQGDLTCLPYEDDAFDYVVSVRTAHVIDEDRIDAYVEELGRVAEEGVFFDTFRKESLAALYHPFLGMDSTLYSDPEIEELVDASGMEVRERDREFTIPYAPFMVSGSHERLEGLTGLLGRMNDGLSSIGADSVLGSVTQWYLEPEE